MRCNALFEQPGDPVSDDPGLPAPRPGDDEDGAVRGRDYGELLFVQLVFIVEKRLVGREVAVQGILFHQKSIAHRGFAVKPGIRAGLISRLSPVSRGRTSSRTENVRSGRRPLDHGEIHRNFLRPRQSAVQETGQKRSIKDRRV